MLGELKETGAAAQLQELTSHENTDIRNAAYSAIADIGDKSVVEPLIDKLKDAHDDPDEMRGAIVALGCIKDERATQQLLDTQASRRF